MLNSKAATIVLEVNVGFDRSTSSLIAGFVQIAFWLGTFPPMVLVDRYGRRPTLLVGSIALTISMVLFVIGIALNTPVSNRLALAMLFIYEISFGMSWNSLPWLIAPEITPLHLRHVGAAIGPFSEWLWTFVCIARKRTCGGSRADNRIGHCSDDAERNRKHWMEVLHPVLYHERAEFPVRIFLPTRGEL